MKIVYLVPREVFERKMSRVRFQQITAIGEQCPVVWTGPGWPHPLVSHAAHDLTCSTPPWDDTLSPASNVERIRIGDDRAELVVAYQVENLEGMHCPVATQFNEAFDTRKVDEYVRLNRISLVIFHHQNDMGRYWFWQQYDANRPRIFISDDKPYFARDDGIDRVHIPHCADQLVYQDYGAEKDIDVLCAGNMNQSYYPFRFRLKELARTYLRKRGHNVVILNHPGYTLPPRAGTVVGVEFARLLNRSKLVMTCSMRYKYALAKYSEIASCRSLAVGDLPEERKEFFSETILNVEPHMTDEKIVRAIEDLLDDESGELGRRTERSWDLTKTEYKMSDYARRFIDAARCHLEVRGLA